MCEITWGGYIALPPSKHQHCTDEAQKAETVLSAVSYIYIYVYIYIYIYIYIHILFYQIWEQRVEGFINIYSNAAVLSCKCSSAWTITLVYTLTKT